MDKFTLEKQSRQRNLKNSKFDLWFLRMKGSRIDYKECLISAHWLKH